MDRADNDRPLWVSIWGGANVLAQAPWPVSHDRPPEQVADFVSRLRVYSISDQDDSGPWLRQTFPKLLWIASLHAFNHYERATWTGIPGEVFDRFESGPGARLASKKWLTQNIIKGPLGSLYPPPAFIMAGDTPAFLYLIPNGPDVPAAPDFGSWGGRYGRIDAGKHLAVARCLSGRLRCTHTMDARPAINHAQLLPGHSAGVAWINGDRDAQGADLIV